MRSYLDILTELKETLASDYTLPRFVSNEANKLIEKLLDLLWRYSD